MSQVLSIGWQVSISFVWSCRYAEELRQKQGSEEEEKDEQDALLKQSGRQRRCAPSVDPRLVPQFRKMVAVHHETCFHANLSSASAL